MSSTATPPPTGPEADEFAQHRRVLALLVDVGATLAQELVEAAPDRAPAPARAEAFEPLARAVRRCILLARHVVESGPAIADPARADPAAAQAQRRTAARARILREVGDAIQRDKPRAADAEALQTELLDRLETPELEADIATRPTEQLIAELIRDFGLGRSAGTHPYARRDLAEVARLHALAALPPGAPRPAPSPRHPAEPTWPQPSRRRSHPKPPPAAPDDDRAGISPDIRPNSLLATLLRRTPDD